MIHLTLLIWKQQFGMEKVFKVVEKWALLEYKALLYFLDLFESLKNSKKF